MNKHKGTSQRISARKLDANRRNAQKSSGPHNSSLARHNATTHGLLAYGVTELDDPVRFRALCSRLEAQLNPIGELEIALVQRIAFCFIRLDRAALMEAEITTARLHPSVTKTVYPEGGNDMSALMESFGKTEVVDPGLPSRLSVSDVDDLQRVQRYETSIENKLYRALNQLERLQRMRQGDRIPAPATGDLSVHHDTDDTASFGNPATQY